MGEKSKKWTALETYGCATILLLPAGILWAGLAISMVWAWFVVPLGAPRLGVLQAAGLDCLVTFIVTNGSLSTFWYVASERFTSEEKLKRARMDFLARVMSPGALLGVGWLLHWFMVRP